jgi:membrane protease YdiL (CAAX protease family)
MTFTASFPRLSPVRVDAEVLLYLLLVVVLMPVGAMRSKGIIAGSRPDRPAPPRTNILSRAVLVQAALFLLSLFVARTHGMDLWPRARVRSVDLGIGLGAFALLLGFGMLSWRLRTPDERRQMWLRHLLPRNRTQWMLWLVVSATAGISEETTYRGVLVILLGSLTASFIAAALLSAIVFAIAHYPQGPKSVALVFAIALVMQAVVSTTGALYVAMGVHAAYDITAGVRAARRFAELEPT